MQLKVTEKFHLVNDESEFQPEALDIVKLPQLKDLKRDYHLVSIIGSQSSGKSTLLNEIFHTSFEVLQRRVKGQTTKGIWFSVDPAQHMFIFDVEGSDANERKQERTKTERCNSLFALSTSNTLLVNIWIHQLGLFKGSQMAILEIVLELNLKLFRSERPKEIIFVIRDFEKDKENPDNLSKTIYNKVRETWDKIAKPPGTENIKLEDLFHLNAFFLPSFIEEKEEFREKVGEVRDFLFKLGRDKTMTDKNVLVADFPQFLNNVWKTIQEEKDLNLPAEKVLIANMRCNDAKTAAFKLIEENFNTILFKAQTTINEDFGSSLRDLVNQALTFYNKATESYPDEQAKIRDEFTKELEFKIENSFKFQLSILSGKIIKNVIQKFSAVGATNEKSTNIEGVKSIEQKAQEKFQETVRKIAYRPEWVEPAKAEFRKQLKGTVDSEKDKIAIDYARQLQSLLRKKIELFVSKALETRDMFTKPIFWGALQKEYETVLELCRRKITEKFTELSLDSKRLDECIFKRAEFCYSELKSEVTKKLKELDYYLVRHFKSDFNFDDKKVPRNWPAMTDQEIDELYKKTKSTYADSVSFFQNFQISQVSPQQPVRNSMVDSKTNTLPDLGDVLGFRKSKDDSHAGQNQLIDFQQASAIKKRFEEECESEYRQAKRKHNDKYTGRIPKWMIALIGVFMIDDVLVWIKSPYLLMPVFVVLLLVVAIMSLSKGTIIEPFVNQIRSTITGQITSALRPGNNTTNNAANNTAREKRQ